MFIDICDIKLFKKGGEMFNQKMRNSFIVLCVVFLIGTLSLFSACGNDQLKTVTFLPTSSATEQSICVTITATFSGSITAPSDWSSVFNVTAANSSTNICTATSGEDTGYSWNSANKTVTCIHDNLSSSTEYTATISGFAGVVDGTSTFTVATAGYLVFITSTTHTGNLGGLSGADDICNTRATEGGLSGTYAAWVSGDTPTNAKDRIVNGKYVKNYCRQTIADNLTELISGTLQNAIDRDESGEEVSGENNVWTGTASDGTVWETDTCDSFTWGATGQDSTVGSSNATTGSWTDTNISYECNESLHIYCFQISD